MNVTRWIPLSGVAAVILIAAGFAAAGSTPSEDAPVSKLVAFYTTHDTGQVASGVLLSVGALLFLIFCAAFVSAVRRTDVGAQVWSSVCFGGGVLFVVAVTIAAGLAVFIGNVAGDLDPAALQALHEANLVVVFPWTVGASAFLLGAGAGVLQSEEVLPRWLGWMAVVLGVIAAIPNHVLGGLLDHIGVIPVAGLGVWTLVVSVLLARRNEPGMT